MSGDDRPLTYAAAFAWTLAATALLVLGVQATVLARPSIASDIVTLAGCEAVVYLLGTFGVLRLHAENRIARNALGMRPSHAAMPVFGLALGLSVQLPAASLQQLIHELSPPSEEELARQAALLAADTPVRMVMLILAAACVAPLVEELFFRGALFGGLRRSGSAIGAALVSAACFVISHPDIRAWLPLLLVALILSHLRVASGSLLPCVALHVSFNGASIAAHLTGVSSVTSPAGFGWPVTLAGWAGTALLVLLVQYVARQSPEAERARAEDADEL